MSESIFHESTSQGITFECVCVGGGGGGGGADTSVFPQDERYGISFITITSVGVGKS